MTQQAVMADHFMLYSFERTPGRVTGPFFNSPEEAAQADLQERAESLGGDGEWHESVVCAVYPHHAQAWEALRGEQRRGRSVEYQYERSYQALFTPDNSPLRVLPGHLPGRANT